MPALYQFQRRVFGGGGINLIFPFRKETPGHLTNILFIIYYQYLYFSHGNTFFKVTGGYSGSGGGPV
jgi:hypothetical protein